MTDAKWLKLIHKCNSLAIEHRTIQAEAEAEYERRYGENPSDVDDDYWIDYVHYGQGHSVSIESIKENAALHFK